jgi:hypothetical protein
MALARRLPPWRVPEWRVPEWRVPEWRVPEWRVPEWRVPDWWTLSRKIELEIATRQGSPIRPVPPSRLLDWDCAGEVRIVLRELWLAVVAVPDLAWRATESASLTPRLGLERRQVLVAMC